MLAASWGPPSVSEEERPRRSYDLSQQEIRQAFDSEALARINLRDRFDEKIDEMKPRLDAVYHEVFGTENQGGVLRDVEELKKERKERHRELREDLVLVALWATVVVGLIAPFFK